MSSDSGAWIGETLGVAEVRRETIQSLWSGYGSLDRVFLADGSCVILKAVMPPQGSVHPRGWNGERGHARKVRSYEVELAFYAQWSPRCTPRCRVARLLGSKVHGRGRWLLLEDLDDAGFGRRPRALQREERSAALRWLAHFHAAFVDTEPAGLWPTGTYWHLETRPDEWAAMAPGPLKDAAKEIDARLNACEFRTFVHGDAKVANFCFGDDDVAAVDFQYVGGGCGMKDVAYFLGSIMDEAECEAEADACVDEYFLELAGALPSSAHAKALEAEWRALYPLAWADFHRFLAGWAPAHGKLHGYTARMTDLALSSL